MPEFEQKTQQEILRAHKHLLDPLYLWSNNAAMFGYVYSSIKFHKIGRRFIAGLYKCSTTILSSILSDVLNFVLMSLQKKDNLYVVRVCAVSLLLMDMRK